MNMNTWIAEREKQHLAQIAIEMERQLMWGNAPNALRKSEARIRLAKLLTDLKVGEADYRRILDMIHSPAEDDLQFAETLIETISTQKSIQHVSNIHSGKPQVPEFRS